MSLLFGTCVWGGSKKNEDDRPLYGQHFIHRHTKNIYYYTVYVGRTL